ncbi:MAG: hypothetical protein ACI9MJ_000299, partial [Alphaproteobacteria bacterium]
EFVDFSTIRTTWRFPSIDHVPKIGPLSRHAKGDSAHRYR